MKTYILGMAKSPLQITAGQFNCKADVYAKTLNSGSLRSLELDYLRLVYATKQLKAIGHNVNAYLMVATPEIVEKVKKWKNKYEVEENIVHIVDADLNEDEIEKLVKEKQRNQIGNNIRSKEKKENAIADNGKNILEGKLNDMLNKKYMQGDHILKTKNMPFQINWDYCKQIEN